MNWFKKLIILIFIFSWGNNNINAQFNMFLRGIYENIKGAPNSNGFPDPAPFFYDFTIHAADSQWFVPINITDTLELSNYWRIYFEMRRCAYDTNLLANTFFLQKEVDTFMAKTDKISFGVMDFEFNRFKPDALDSGKYFWWNNFDSVLHDIHARPTEPYMINSLDPNKLYNHEMFLALPLKNNSYFRDVTFSFNSNFLFYGSNYSTYNRYTKPQPNHKFYVDFGDGFGPQPFDPNVQRDYSVVYPEKGEYEISAMVFEDGNLIKYSKSTFIVKSDQRRIMPDEIITSVDGLSAGIYYACDEQPQLNKVIIAVSGYDLDEGFGHPQIYNQLISKPQIIMLQNYGYDVVTVDWTDSKRSMFKNGDALINLIEHLKNKIEDIEHNFVVVGISLGAVLSNYALTKMESPAYRQSIESDTNIVFKDQLHNTRLFLSTEGEYQAAFINVGGMQIAKHIVSSEMFKDSDIYDFAKMEDHSKYVNDLIERPIHKELLKHHISVHDGNWHYYQHTMRTIFKNYIKSIGSHPKKCKTVALSDGLADGSPQVAYGNVEAKPYDDYFDLHVNGTFRYLWRPTIVIDLHINLKTYPEQNVNPIKIANVDFCYTRPKKSFRCFMGYLFVNPVLTSFCTKTKTTNANFYVRDMIPWDNRCGGRISIGNEIFGKGTHLSGPKSPPFLSFNYDFKLDRTNGNTYGEIDMKVGFLKVSTIYVNATSELESFNFVPYFNASDYVRADSFNQDILNTSIDSNLARTPFDVMIYRVPKTSGTPKYPFTFPSKDERQGTRNYSHYLIHRDEVDKTRRLTVLTREVGERLMHLDNQTIDRKSMFEVTDTMNVGYNANPTYETPNYYDPDELIRGIFSQVKKFEVIKHGDVQMRAGQEIIFSPGFEVRDSGELHAWIELMDTCNISLKNLRERRIYLAEPKSLILNKKPEITPLKLYPNPTEDKVYIQGLKSTALLTVYSINGHLLEEKLLTADKNNLSLKNLKSGIYLIRVHIKDNVQHFKVIKQ